MKHKFLVTEDHLGIPHRFQSPSINMRSPDHPQRLHAPPLPLRPDMKAWTYLVVTFIAIENDASAKEFFHAMDHGESHHNARVPSKYVPHPRHLPRPDIFPVLGCYNQKDVNVEGSKDGRWLDKGKAEPFIAFCIIRITA